MCIRTGKEKDGRGSISDRGKTGSSADPAVYPMGTVGCLPEDEADHSRAASVEVKNDGAIPPLPDTSSYRGVWFIKHRDNFTFFTLRK
jgi:hypothetical protein